jgi:hypothetical protein
MNENPLGTLSSSPLEIRLPSRGSIFMPTCFHSFKAWKGHPISDTYGGKAVIDCDGEPLFAELAILRMIQAKGWKGVWIDTYRRKFRQSLPPQSCELPEHAQAVLERASAGHKWRPGCFDVFGWKDGQYLFAEAKRKGKDAIRETQFNWLESALDSGLPLESFLIFEWGILGKERADKLT